MEWAPPGGFGRPGTAAAPRAAGVWGAPAGRPGHPDSFWRWCSTQHSSAGATLSRVEDRRNEKRHTLVLPQLHRFLVTLGRFLSCSFVAPLPFWSTRSFSTVFSNSLWLSCTWRIASSNREQVRDIRQSVLQSTVCIFGHHNFVICLGFMSTQVLYYV